MEELITTGLNILAVAVVLWILGGLSWSLFQQGGDEATSEHDRRRQALDALNADAYRKADAAQRDGDGWPGLGVIAREADRLALQGEIEYYTLYPDKDSNGQSLARAKRKLNESRYYENSPKTTDPKAWKEYADNWK